MMGKYVITLLINKLKEKEWKRKPAFYGNKLKELGEIVK